MEGKEKAEFRQELEKCVFCKREYSSADPVTRPPTCSESCWGRWICSVDHREGPCWMPGYLEVYCGIRTPGHCYKCDIFRVEREIKKKRQNKDILIGNY